MRKLRYVFSHALTPLLAVLLAVVLLTQGVWFVLSQRRSMRNGIEVLLIDTALTSGENEQLAKSIREKTGVPYVGISSLSSSEAEQYVKTVQGYGMEAYLRTLTRSRDAELLFAPASLLETVLPLALPLEIDIPAGEECMFDGVLRAMPVRGLAVTDYGACLSALAGDVYAVLLPGDHADDARDFLRVLQSV